MNRLADADARSFWISERMRTDQFLLYTFVATDVPVSATAAHLRRCASSVPDLCLRIVETPADLDRPYWVRAHPAADQVRVVDPAEPMRWQDCLDLVAGLEADQLDPRREAWRLHVIGPVNDSRRDRTEQVVVVVLQVVHALGDGRRTARIARELFAEAAEGAGEMESRPSARQRLLWASATATRAVAAGVGVLTLPVRLAGMVASGLRAYRVSRSDSPAQFAGVPPSPLNTPPGRDRVLRTLVVDRRELSAFPTVTVAALTAISIALTEGLGEQTRSAVELTIGRPGSARARNHFRTAGVDLHIDTTDLRRRADLIASGIAAARARDDSPLRRAQRRAGAWTPAALVHRDLRGFDLVRRPDRVTGVTVVSSVNRGPADLTLGGGQVTSTAGFPALSPAQGLTHGVHGIGDTVTISVVTSRAVLPNPDEYVQILDRALRRCTDLGTDGGSAQDPDPASPIST
ncbi:wax ester/triacylglycerol synthase domain-containing protein [Gordonia soli]|uniref:Uncharacterized protein n=1 Tax=Gordonia soli NBRC 108243 TaxID=1223545 RepID=M0QDF2_9ACTN|nr:wax ester/triacylglycerol synthase domain-containing protein [Gordonia soli]GAC66459.1 hypothetical protein GS4_02_01700 [Gordonia soli NBRC 108243]